MQILLALSNNNFIKLMLGNIVVWMLFQWVPLMFENYFLIFYKLKNAQLGWDMPYFEERESEWERPGCPDGCIPRDRLRISGRVLNRLSSVADSSPNMCYVSMWDTRRRPAADWPY